MLNKVKLSPLNIVNVNPLSWSVRESSSLSSSQWHSLPNFLVWLTLLTLSPVVDQQSVCLGETSAGRPAITLKIFQIKLNIYIKNL